MSRARKEGESFEDYRKAIRLEDRLENDRLRGRWVHKSKCLIKPDRLTPEVFASRNQGTLRSKVK